MLFQHRIALWVTWESVLVALLVGVSELTSLDSGGSGIHGAGCFWICRAVVCCTTWLGTWKVGSYSSTSSLCETQFLLQVLALCQRAMHEFFSIDRQCCHFLCSFILTQDNRAKNGVLPPNLCIGLINTISWSYLIWS